MQDSLSTGVIDLGVARREELTENYLAQLGAQLEYALKQMFAGTGGSMKVRGTRSEIEAFKRALGSERNYLDSYMRSGLNDPRTIGSRHKLAKSVMDFERATGLKWPFG
tara:strand:+ start:723 stop:1049 length:327 start_codon:yes stop_codon:yes gene_type:complete